MMKTLYNLRPYSWVDLILLGFVAKFSVTRQLAFDNKDIFMILGVLFLWCFFNIVLELRHGYSYRGKTSIFPALILLFLALVTGVYFNTYTLIFTLISTLLVILYLLKNKVLGNISAIVRGLIQSSYFYYALFFYTSAVDNIHIILGIIVLFVTAARSLIGDFRDYKHNKAMKKKTFVVSHGIKTGIAAIEILLVLSTLLLIKHFNLQVSVPLILLFILLFFFRNGYVLHQLTIMVTSFLNINLITSLTNNNLLFTNLIFLGIFLNMVFYPLLKRKSNPKF